MANAVKARTPGSRRRDFRLSPLETMILGLILVVAIYLISVWARGAEGPAPPTVTEVPGSQLERALAATEAVQAQISSLVKEIDALRQEVNDLSGGQDKGKGKGKSAATPALNKRLSQLERRVESLGKEVKVSPSEPDPELAARVAKLEKDLARVEKAPAPPPPPRVKPAPVEKAPPKPQAEQLVPVITKPAPEESVSAATPKGRKVIYKVRRGNTLLGVALHFKVKVSDIRQWNPKVKTRKYLWVGEKLTIYPGPNYKP